MSSDNNLNEKNLSDKIFINKEQKTSLQEQNSFTSSDLRCSICLTFMEDPTILSNCFHTFCYVCIIEWLKMKPECPLCKRSPQYFKHKFQLLPDQILSWDLPAERLNFLT